ncbi:hypothetical protein Tco_1316293 [Tanacetum coccineum]
MHNNIMAAGSRDRPTMLATRRYAQWRSRFLRYIDTRPNGDALRKCIVEGPYNPTTVVVPVVPATENSPVEFGQFTSHDGETIESYYTRFYKMMNEMIRNNLTVATMQVNVQFLQQLQPEWSSALKSNVTRNLEQGITKSEFERAFSHIFGLENDQGLENQSNTSGDESSMSRNECNDKSTSGDDTDISPTYDTIPMIEVQYTVEHNVFVVDTQHSEQSECINNTCVVEKVDSNVIPDSPDMYDNEIQNDHNAI